MRFIMLSSCLLIAVIAWPVRADVGPPAVTAAPPEDVEGAIDLLLGEDLDAARRAHRILLEKGIEAAPSLRSRLAEAEGDSAYRLILALSRLDDPESAGILRQTWEKSTHFDVRLAASMALCRLDVEFDRFLNFIANQARSGDENQRLEAMQMLGYIEDARVVPLLKNIFYDQKQTDFVRQAAVWDLAHIPVPESVYALVGMISDPDIDWFYKEIILTALRNLAREEELVAIISQELERVQRLPRLPGPSDH